MQEIRALLPARAQDRVRHRAATPDLEDHDQRYPQVVRDLLADVDESLVENSAGGSRVRRLRHHEELGDGRRYRDAVRGHLEVPDDVPRKRRRLRSKQAGSA